MNFQTASHKVGLSLRAPYFPRLECSTDSEAACFEAQVESHLNSHGEYAEVLNLLRRDYPIALHGMSLNLGCAQGISLDYLRQLTVLSERLEPFIVSDHLGWSGTPTHHLHCLLPLPYTHEALDKVCDNVDLVQSFLRRPLTIENIASYVLSREDEMSEVEFLRKLCERKGCNLLLDLGAVYVNGKNQGFRPEEYLMNWPFEKTAQIHLSGPSLERGIVIDSRSEPVPSELWGLFALVAPLISHLPIVVERDRNIPTLREMEDEVRIARSIMEKRHETERSPELI